MSAQRLHEAARVLRDHIEGLPTDEARWDDAFPVSRVYADKSTYERLIVHPGVGLALADLLDSQARTCDKYGVVVPSSTTTLADLILGSAPRSTGRGF